MKAHFKRSMKEYEAKYLKENNNEKKPKSKFGSEQLDEGKNMPKFNHSQEETQMNIASSVASSSMNTTIKDTKTTTKRSFLSHKRAYNIHCSGNMKSSVMNFHSNLSQDHLKQEEGDVDMEDNNNELIIDESESVEDSKETLRDVRIDETHEKVFESNLDNNRKYNDSATHEGKEEDIVVDDEIDGEEDHCFSSKRRRTPSENQSVPSSSQLIKAYRTDCNPENDILKKQLSESFSIGEDESENEDDNINITSDAIEDGQDCDNSLKEVNIKCNWCQRAGPCSIKMHVSDETKPERMEGEGKNILRDHHSRQNKHSREKKVFCNERCFSLYRRAAFKKNRRCEWCRRPSKQPLLVKDNKHRHFCRYVNRL